MNVKVFHGKVKDALGRIQEGWIVQESGSTWSINGIYPSKEKAIKAAVGILSIRRSSGKVIVEE